MKYKQRRSFAAFAGIEIEATKENAEAALEVVDDLLAVDGLLGKVPDLAFLQEFIKAAERKLPSEAAYQAEIKRGRCQRICEDGEKAG